MSVGNGDLDRVVVEMKRGVEVTGKIVVEGAPLPAWPQISLIPTDGLYVPDLAAVDADGGFRVAGLEPAHYRVNLGAMPPPLFVKSIRVNGHDLNGTMDLASTPAASLEIVLARGTGSIHGTVSDSDGPAGPSIIVLAARETPPVRFAQTDENGAFSLEGLPPGDYRVIAVDMGPTDLIPRDAIEKLGQSVVVAERGSAAANVRLTTMDELQNAAHR